MALTVVFICWSILFWKKVHITMIGTLEKATILTTAHAQESSHDCYARLWRCGKFRHALIQTYLLLATKPTYTRKCVQFLVQLHQTRFSSTAFVSQSKSTELCSSAAIGRPHSKFTELCSLAAVVSQSKSTELCSSAVILPQSKSYKWYTV